MKLSLNIIILLVSIISLSCNQNNQEAPVEQVDPTEQYKASLIILDSLLNDIETERPELLKNFYIEDELATVPVFIHKRQSTKSSHDRTYVRAHATKNGDLYLSSHYVGQAKINHYKILIACGENFIETDSITNDALNHSFENDGLIYEIVKFKKNPEAAAFIANNYEQKISLTFIGPTRKYKTFLTETDKKAIHEAFLLANSFKESADIQAQITNLHSILDN